MRPAIHAAFLLTTGAAPLNLCEPEAPEPTAPTLGAREAPGPAKKQHALSDREPAAGPV